MNMIDHLAALELGRLNKPEQAALDHLRKKPDGRGFYSAAEVLVRHQKVDEAIQLLMYGLDRHPNYSVARVFLVQLFFARHFFREAWNYLEASPSSLKANLTAQIFRLKLCIMLDFEAEAKNVSRELKLQEFHDPEAKALMEELELKSFAKLRQDYAFRLGWGGIHDLPELKPQDAQSLDKRLANQGQDEANLQLDFQDRVVRGFFTSPIQEIFIKPDHSRAQKGELDELTKARLARRQGLYQTALDIFQRLAYAAPGNELLRRELMETRDLRDAQKEIDQNRDPDLAYAMEKVRFIDKKIATLNQILKNLE